MSILSELKQQKHSLDDLAKLPQSLIMQMAQRKQIMPEMVAPILSRKAEMMEAVAKTKAIQSAPQAMAQPTVLESLMAKNVQPPQAQPQQAQPMAQSSVDLAGLAQMQPKFAGGGVVAFAGGDYVDGETADPEDEEFARHQAYLNRIISTYGKGDDDLELLKQSAKTADSIAKPAARKAPDTVVALALPTSKTYQMERSAVAEKRPEDTKPEVKEVTKEKVAVTQPVKPKPSVKAAPHPYAGMVAQDAKKYGVDPSISLRILNNETGNIKNPETAVSSAGAVGIAQFMPGTAKQYKIDPTDPKQASDAMNRHVKHLMRQYGDPQIVAIAYNWGEGNTNRWLKNGADPRRLPKETQNYLDKFMRTALAQGGEVKGYAEGGEVNSQSYAEKMKKVFGYEPFHGPAMKKYMSGGEVKHFQTGDYVGGLKLPPKSTSTAGDFFRSIGGEDAVNAVREGYYKSREFEDQMSGAEDLYPGLFESMTPEERARRIKAGDILFKGPQTVKKMTPAEIEAANAKIMAVSPKESTSQAPADSKSNAASRRGPSEPPPETVVEPPPAMSMATPESIQEVMAGLNEKPEEPFPKIEVSGVEPDEYAELMKESREAKTASAKQRKEDKAYAMIMAGLATMGGESPNALTNIAKGQATGLGMLQENRKQSAAEDAKLLQMQGTVLRYKDAALLAKEAQNQTIEYKNTLAELKRLQLDQNKDAKDAENQRKLEADAEKQRVGLERSFAKIHDLHFEIPKLQYKELMDQAGKAVLPEERDALEARANKILMDAQNSFRNNPIAQRYERLLYPEIDFDAVRKPPPAPPPALDTSKFKVVK